MTKNELKKAQKEYMLALAAHETARAIEREAKTNVLRDNIFREEETGERITRPTADFLMSDSDFPEYCKLVHDEMFKMGLNVPIENTADYQTFPALKAAENKMIEMAIAIVPKSQQKDVKSASQHWKYRQEVIDLTLRLAL